MKKILILLLCIVIFFSLSACEDASTKTSANKNDDDEVIAPFDLDDKSNNPFFIVTRDTKKSEVMQLYGEPDIGNGKYTDFEAFGYKGRLEFGFWDPVWSDPNFDEENEESPTKDGDLLCRSVVFSYKFPGSVDWVSEIMGRYQPSDDEKEEAERFVDTVVTVLSEKYGEPVRPESDTIYYWDLSSLYFESYICIEKRSDGISVYYELR